MVYKMLVQPLQQYDIGGDQVVSVESVREDMREDCDWVLACDSDEEATQVMQDHETMNWMRRVKMLRSGTYEVTVPLGETVASFMLTGMKEEKSNG